MSAVQHPMEAPRTEPAGLTPSPWLRIEYSGLRKQHACSSSPSPCRMGSRRDKLAERKWRGSLRLSAHLFTRDRKYVGGPGSGGGGRGEVWSVRGPQACSWERSPGSQGWRGHRSWPGGTCREPLCQGPRQQWTGHPDDARRARSK